MSRPRNQAWLRDELILALDLYTLKGPRVSNAAADELSTILRSIPIDVHLTSNPKFRNRGAVLMKMGNFVALDPSQDGRGLPRHGKLDEEVWAEYSGDPARLRSTAEAILGNLQLLDPGVVIADEFDSDEDAPEGRILTREHRVRERSKVLVTRKKKQALKATGCLTCEVCDFDFSGRYGARGEGFIECHHTQPVQSLTPGHRTRLSDLALLCSNCHRMIHRSQPWLSIDELRALIQ
jgi:5-methylcytosine-specific restriction protein A